MSFYFYHLRCCYIDSMTWSIFYLFFSKWNIDDCMESVKQMQHSAASHSSFLRHTELFVSFRCKGVEGFDVFCFFFPNSIQFNTKCKIIFIELLRARASCHLLKVFMWFSSQPAGDQSAALHWSSWWEKSTDSDSLWDDDQPHWSDWDWFQKGAATKYVVHYLIYVGEAATKQRWQGALDLRQLLTWKLTTLFFFFMQLQL